MSKQLPDKTLSCSHLCCIPCEKSVPHIIGNIVSYSSQSSENKRYSHLANYHPNHCYFPSDIAKSVPRTSSVFPSRGIRFSLVDSS